MTTFTACKQQITDYIAYSGQNAEDWDVEQAARDLYDFCVSHNFEPDEVLDDDFTEILCANQL